MSINENALTEFESDLLNVIQSTLGPVNSIDSSIGMVDSVDGYLSDIESDIAAIAKDVEATTESILDSRFIDRSLSKAIDQINILLSTVIDVNEEKFAQDMSICGQLHPNLKPNFPEWKSALSKFKPVHIHTLLRSYKPKHWQEIGHEFSQYGWLHSVSVSDPCAVILHAISHIEKTPSGKLQSQIVNDAISIWCKISFEGLDQRRVYLRNGSEAPMWSCILRSPIASNILSWINTNTPSLYGRINGEMAKEITLKFGWQGDEQTKKTATYLAQSFENTLIPLDTRNILRDSLIEKIASISASLDPQKSSLKQDLEAISLKISSGINVAATAARASKKSI
jgi:hypothetical protein